MSNGPLLPVLAVAMLAEARTSRHVRLPWPAAAIKRLALPPRAYTIGCSWVPPAKAPLSMSSNFQFWKVLQTLRHRNFGIFVAGNCVSLIGTWTQRVATGWLTWEFTHSATWLGAMAFADLVPAVLIGPLAGVAADRWDRLSILKSAQLVGMAIGATLAVLYFLGRVDVWVLFAITLALGIVDAFIQPFRLAFVSSLVPRADLITAVAIRSTTFNLARFIGPAVAGIVIATSGVGLAFLINAFSFVALLVALMALRVEPMVRLPHGRQVSVLGDALEGARAAFTTRGIGTVLMVLAVSCLMARPVIELLPGWAGDVFNGSSSDLAMFTSSIGLGAMIGGIWLSGRPDPVGLFRVFLTGLFGLAISLLAFSASPTALIAAPILVVAGFFFITSAISAQTLVQMNVEDTLRGRVLSVYAIILRGGPAIGAVAMGFAGDIVGMRWPMVAGAIAVLVATVLVVRRYDELRPLIEDDLK